jgi:hypothetical protein
MSEEIIKKIEKKGYKADKELALNTYNELKTSIRHEETFFTTLLSIFLALLMLPKEFGLIKILIEFSFLFALVKSLYYYYKVKKLLKKLSLIIIEDPMDKDDLETWMTIVINAIFIAIGLIILFFY